MGMRMGRVASILLAAVVLAALWNTFGGRGLALTQNAFLEPGNAVDEVEAAEAKRRLDQGALFLDARPVDFYRMGHIPGALPLPEDDFDKAFAKLEPVLRSRFDIVVYCSGFGCEASHIVARKLKERQVQAVVLHEGWPAWTDAGYPVRAGDAP